MRWEKERSLQMTGVRSPMLSACLLHVSIFPFHYQHYWNSYRLWSLDCTTQKGQAIGSVSDCFFCVLSVHSQPACTLIMGFLVCSCNKTRTDTSTKLLYSEHFDAEKRRQDEVGGEIKYIDLGGRKGGRKGHKGNRWREEAVMSGTVDERLI